MKNSERNDNRKNTFFNNKATRNFVLGGLLGAGLLTLLPATGLARWGGKSGPPDADQVTAQMASNLNLTEEQKKKVQPIIEAEMAKRSKLMEKERAERQKHRQEMGAKMEKIDQETEAALAGVLSAEQREQYAKLLEERRQFRKQRMEMRGGRGGMGSGMGPGPGMGSGMGPGMGMGGRGPCAGYGPYGDGANWQE